MERLPATVVAERFSYCPQYIHLLRHQFTHGKIDFSEPVPEGTGQRRRVDAATRAKMRTWREHRLSGGEIAGLLSEEGVEISVHTVERVLAEEGFPRLPRRTRVKLGRTVTGTEIPPASEIIRVDELGKRSFDCDSAGMFLFAPLIERLNIEKIIKEAGLPGTKLIPALSYFLSFLSLKLLGTERYAHVGDHAFDPGLGPWKRITTPHAKRKYPNPLVYESLVTLQDYEGELRQVVVRGTDHEKPAFLISNDLDTPLELLVGNYPRRGRVENVISEAVKFFNLNCLSSPILVKVHFELVMTMIADTLYSMLANRLRGFERCDAPKIFRLFIKGKATV